MIVISLPVIPANVLAAVEDLLDGARLRYHVEQPDPTRNGVGPSTKNSDTSRRAALANFPKSGSQRERVLTAIRRSGTNGMTRDELAHYLRLPDSSVDGRVWELKHGQWVCEADHTRPTSSGGDAHALILTAKSIIYFSGR
jgi:hypothetical protein